MTGRAWPSACRRAALLLLAAFCAWQGVDAALAYLGASDAYRYLSDWRAAAREAPAGRLALLCGDSGCISPADRTRLTAISWERAPDPVDLADASACLQASGCVLSSRWVSVPDAERLRSSGLSAVSGSEHVKTWCRREAARRAPPPADVPAWREAAALAAELALLVLAVAAASGSRDACVPALVASLAVAAAHGVVALSHPLLAPNGLGVYGGKAKLLLGCGGIPRPFLDSAAGAALQPSYPPGLTLFACLHFALSGGCGDRLVQMLVVFAMSGVCFATLQGRGGLRSALPAALFCLSPVAARMTSGFYAEPFAALALLLGWGMACRGRRLAGALVMGLAGAFRPEGGAVAAAFALGVPGGGVRGKATALAASVAPAIAWVAACGALGYGGLPDWDFFSAPSPGQVAYAAWAEAKALFLHVAPAMAMALLLRLRTGREELRRAERGLRRSCCGDEPGACLGADCGRTAFLAWAALLLAVPAVCGFHASPHARWMIDNTVPRLVWQVSAIPMAMAVRRACPRRMENGRGQKGQSILIQHS